MYTYSYLCSMIIMDRKAYMKQYRKEHRKQLNEYQRQWYSLHKGKATEYCRRSKEKKKAEEEQTE